MWDSIFSMSKPWFAWRLKTRGDRSFHHYLQCNHISSQKASINLECLLNPWWNTSHHACIAAITQACGDSSTDIRCLNTNFAGDRCTVYVSLCYCPGTVWLWTVGSHSLDLHSPVWIHRCLERTSAQIKSVVNICWIHIEQYTDFTDSFSMDSVAVTHSKI